MNIQPKNYINNQSYSPAFNGNLFAKIVQKRHRIADERLDVFIKKMSDASDSKIEKVCADIAIMRERVALRINNSQDGEIYGWMIPSVFPSKKYYIFFHGGTSTITNYQQLYKNLSVEDLNVLAVEYPGYGINKSVEPTFENIEKTAEKAYEYLTKEMGIESKDINIMGYCFGSSVATKLASKVDCNSLTLISPVTSLPQISSGYLKSKDVKLTLPEKIQNFVMTKFGIKPKLYDKINSYEYVDSINCPIIVLSSKEDPVTDLKWIDNFADYISSKGKSLTYIKGLEEGHKLSKLKSAILSIIANNDHIPTI